MFSYILCDIMRTFSYILPMLETVLEKFSNVCLVSACASVSLFKTQSQNKTDVIDSATSQASSCSHFFFNVKVHTPTSVLCTQLYVYSSLTISKKLGVWQRQLQHGITTFRFVSEIFLKTKISTER